MTTSPLISALTKNDTRTENGMLTNTTSNSSLLDLFFTIGALRNEKDESRIEKIFSAAYYENKDDAMRILFWARDVREGAGERRVFRVISKWLAVNKTSSIRKNLKNIPEYGRWDDLLYIYENCGDILKIEIEDVLKEAILADQNQLAAKWLPRKGNTARMLRQGFNMTPKQWRKTLVNLTNVIETKMCSKEWGAINYNHVPSLASSRYTKAFYKNDAERYKQWIEDLKEGKNGAKINAGAVYPYDIIKSLRESNYSTERQTAQEQWKALPNYMSNSNFRIMPVVDTSGSMGSIVGGTTTCMDVAISLGLYISERNIGPYKDHFITFSREPKLQRIIGSTLYDRYNMLSRAEWGMSTNISKVFDLILDTAINNKLKESDMPTHILILSDMEFDSASRGNGNVDVNFMKMVKDKYKNAGYNKPDIIFWNIQSRNDNIPVKQHKSGTALVSGFSPSILKNILTGEIEPTKIMLSVINSDRYKNIFA